MRARFRVVFGAVAANLGIAVAKFIAASLSGSSAMISEGIHSLVDTGNGLLLFVGMRLSQRPPDAHHPFGYGKEQYFWSLIVAIMIFSVGGGMSFYEGIQHLNVPYRAHSALLSYVVLSIALVLEGTSWIIALREFRKGGRHTDGLFAAVRASKDPSVFSVLLEDTAAIAGLFVAFAGVAFGHWFDDPRCDAAASMIIGLILASVAVFLAYESRELLVGERAAPEVVASIRMLAGQEPTVERVIKVLTMHLGPHNVLVNLNLRFRANLRTAQVGKALARLERRIRAAHKEVQYVFIDVRALAVTKRRPSRSPAIVEMPS